MGISLHGGSVGQPGVGLSTGEFEIWLKGALECLSPWELYEGSWRDGSLAGDPEGYIEKALETAISFHSSPVWGTWRRTGLAGTLREDEGGCGDGVSLSEGAPWRGPSGAGGSSFTGDPGRYVKKVSGYGHLSL